MTVLISQWADAAHSCWALIAPPMVMEAGLAWPGCLRVPDDGLITLATLSTMTDITPHTEADTRPRVLEALSSDINLDNVNMLLGSTFFTSL